MAYGVYKDLPKTTDSDKVLHNKTFAIAAIRSKIDINKESRQRSTNFLIKNLMAILVIQEHELFYNIDN